MNLNAIKIIGTCMVLYSFFIIINCVNNLLIFLDLVKIHGDYLFADRAARCIYLTPSTFMHAISDYRCNVIRSAQKR